MCGIAFILSKNNSKISDNLNKHFIEYLYDRGPNNQSFYSEKNFSLISTRLSVIDTDKRSDQPFFSKCKNYIMVFNGMIYNYRDLKRDYLKDYTFSTSSDTEVVLNMYIKYGKDCSKYLDGMFAFIIYDKKNNNFFISRDKTGIKPLYFCSNENYIFFSSSFKSLIKFSQKKISQSGLANYLNFGYSLEPNTILDDIKIFPNSSYAEIDNIKFKKQKYLDLRNLYFKKKYNQKHDYKLIENKLSQVIENHTLSDVPKCLFLSSGFDSNIIAAYCKKLKIQIDTITLSFEKFKNTKDDETLYVKELNRIYGFKNIVVYIKDDELIELKKEFEKKIDHPSTDGFNTYLITYYAKKLGYKVALSGLGGDEIFNTYGNLEKVKLTKGFNKFINYLKLNKLTKNILKITKFNFKIKNIIQEDLRDLSLYIFARSLFLRNEIKEISKHHLGFDLEDITGHDDFEEMYSLKEKLLEKKISYFESNIYMKNQLLRDSDWASMANSVELRVPFANSELIDFFSNYKNNKNSRINILKDINYEIYKIIKDKPKTGFSVPMNIFLKEKNQNPYRKFSLDIIKQYLNKNLDANY